MRRVHDENEPAVQDQPGLEGEAAGVGVERVVRFILGGEPVAYSWPNTTSESDLQRDINQLRLDWYAGSFLCKPPDEDDAG